MPIEKWVETKREEERNAKGEVIGLKVTTESMPYSHKTLTYRDWIDLVIKVIGFAAIFMPLFLFYKTQKSEIDRQRQIMRYETYSIIDLEVHRAKEQISNGVECDSSISHLRYNLIPKALLFDDSEIVRKIQLIGNELAVINIYLSAKHALGQSIMAEMNAFQSHNSNNSKESKIFCDSLSLALNSLSLSAQNNRDFLSDHLSPLSDSLLVQLNSISNVHYQIFLNQCGITGGAFKSDWENAYRLHSAVSNPEQNFFMLGDSLMNICRADISKYDSVVRMSNVFLRQ